MQRIIRIDYRFKYAGRFYEGRGVSVGETIEDSTTENENRLSAVYDALGPDGYDILRLDAEPVNWTDTDWRKAGFEFEYCEESA